MEVLKLTTTHQGLETTAVVRSWVTVSKFISVAVLSPPGSTGRSTGVLDEARQGAGDEVDSGHSRSRGQASDYR
jgi:hypothetical protein